jgi:pimeloyl-ACP methyl ester carboxylesterase
VTRQYCHIGQRTIAYLDSAPGKAALRTLVLLHAFPLGADMWESQMRAVLKGWRLITPDLRGFGGSTEGDSSIAALSMDDYSEDVIDLLGELGVSRFTLGGCSMGGYATFALLAGHAEKVDALVLIDTRETADTPEGRANRRNMLAVVDREGPSGVAREMMPKLVGATTRATDSTVEATLRRLIKQQSPVAIRSAILRMMHRPDQSGLLPGIAVPTLIVAGEEDELIPMTDAQRMAAAIRGSTLVKIPRAGHLPNLEQPDAFNAALAGFLSTL